MIEPREIEVYDVYHLPIIKASADRIDLVGTINRLVPSRMNIDPGPLLLAVVLDAVSGRHPLYRIGSFHRNKDIELLLGRPIDIENVIPATVIPSEANPQLVVDPNGPLPRPIACKLFKKIAGGHAAELRCSRTVELCELTEGNSRDISRNRHGGSAIKGFVHGNSNTTGRIECTWAHSIKY